MGRAWLESQKGAYALARPNHHILVSEGPGIRRAPCHRGVAPQRESNGAARGGVYLGGPTMAQKGSSTSRRGLPDGTGLKSQKGAYPLARPNHHILVSEGLRAT